MKRIAIVGVPGAGKTSLATQLGKQHQIPVRHTDALRSLSWKGQGAASAALLNEGSEWILEGVQVARGLRRWLRANDAGKPVDTLIVMRNSRGEETGGRSTLGKGVLTVLDEVVPALRERGVKIIEHTSLDSNGGEG